MSQENNNNDEVKQNDSMSNASEKQAIKAVVEEGKRGRALMGQPVVKGAAGLAYRMLRHVDEAPRRHLRPAHRRRGQRLPAP